MKLTKNIYATINRLEIGLEMKKIPISNILLTIFIIILLLSAYAQIEYQVNSFSKTHAYYDMYAHKLTDKPAYYFALTDPDQFVLKAINSGTYVEVDQNDTQIDELINHYGTNNITYGGSYYTIQLAFVDAFPSESLPYIQAGIYGSVFGIIVILIFKGWRYFQATNQQKKAINGLSPTTNKN